MDILAAVCKSGGSFGLADVMLLRNRIRRVMPGFTPANDYQIICLTDFPHAAVEASAHDHLDLDAPGDIPNPLVWFQRLIHGWPGWWSKIELFRPGLFSDGDRILYMDLDTVPVGDFSDLWNGIGDDGKLIMLRDFYHPAQFSASGVMGWTGDYLKLIYNVFNDDPDLAMRSFQEGMPRGDGAFIPWALSKSDGFQGYWQDEYPGRLVSYKVHCRDGLPKDASLVCFHGKPRPTEIDEPWL